MTGKKQFTYAEHADMLQQATDAMRLDFGRREDSWVRQIHVLEAKNRAWQEHVHLLGRLLSEAIKARYDDIEYRPPGV